MNPDVALSSGEEPARDRPAIDVSQCGILGRIRRRVSTRRVALFLLLLLVSAFLVGWRYRITRADYRLERAEEAVAASNYKSAEQLARKLEDSGHRDHAHLVRGQIYYRQGQPDLALAECNEIRGSGQIRIKGAVLSGRSLLDLGAYIEAFRVFSFVLSEEFDNVDAHRGLAMVTHELGQTNRAVLHLEHVMRLDPSDARPHRMLGVIYWNSGETEKAIVHQFEALRIRNGLSDLVKAEVRFELAEALNRVSRFAEAIKVLDEPEPDPNEPEFVQALRIEALRGIGRKSDATALADSSIRKHPSAAFYRLRAQLYLDEADAQNAIRLLETSYGLAPNYYQTCSLLGQAYALADRQKDAERMNARADAIRKDYESVSHLKQEAIDRPWDSQVRIKLAEIHARLGDQQSAEKWRRAAAQCRGQTPKD